MERIFSISFMNGKAGAEIFKADDYESLETLARKRAYELATIMGTSPTKIVSLPKTANINHHVTTTQMMA